MMRWDIMQRKVLLNQKFQKAVEKTMGEKSGHIQGKAFSTYLGGTENWTQINTNEVNLIQKQVKAIEVNKAVAKTIINIQSRSTEKLPEIKKPAIKTVTLTRNQSLPRQTRASDLRMSWTRKSYPNLVTIPNELPRKWSHERPKHKPDGRSTLTKLFYLPKISTTRPRRTNVKDFLPYLLN
uniref:Uncharacterized protein n=1 Tax=Acrobeloides nanus TaxID=290746 RepID=A0A914E738_9BILA